VDAAGKREHARLRTWTNPNPRDLGGSSRVTMIIAFVTSPTAPNAWRSVSSVHCQLSPPTKSFVGSG
jgi:hypothetical protein